MVLPTYAFQHNRYWLDLPTGATGDAAVALGLTSADHPLLGAVVHLPETDGFRCTGRLPAVAAPAPGAQEVPPVFAEAALVEALIRVGERTGYGTLDDLVIEEPLVLPTRGALVLHVSVSGPDDSGRRTVEVHTRAEGADDLPWTFHATGFLTATAADPGFDFAQWPPPAAEPVARPEVRWAPGQAPEGLRTLWRRGDELFAEVELEPSPQAPAAAHSALLTDAVRVAGLLAEQGSQPFPDRILVPFAWSGVAAYAGGAARLRVRVAPGPDGGVALQAADTAGAPVLAVRSLAFRELAPDRLRAARTPLHDTLFRLDWTPVILPLGNGAPTTAPAPGADAARTALRSGTAPVVLLAEGAITVPGEATGQRFGEPEELARDLIARLDVPPSVDGPATPQASPPMLVLTRGAAVTRGGSEPVDPVAAAVGELVRAHSANGPGRVLLVDIDDEDASWSLLPTLPELAEPRVAVRAGQVLAPRLARLAEPPVADASTGTALTGTVLVAGDPAGLGGTVARHLAAAHGVATLLLVTGPGTDPGQVRELAADLAASGTTLELAACDPADRTALAALLAQVPSDRPLTAVLHAMEPVTADEGKEKETIRPARVRAALHLDELTREAGLGAFVLCVPAERLLTEPDGGWAPADAFLTAVVQRRRAVGLPAVAVGLGPWKGVRGGDAVPAPGAPRALSDQEGTGVLDAALRTDETLLVALRPDLTGRRAGAVEDVVHPLLRGLVRPRQRDAENAAVRDDSLAVRLAGMAEADQHRVLLDLVRDQAAAVLGYAGGAAVGADLAFKEVGFDSLTAIELRNRLGAATGLRLPATLLFDHPTPAHLAGTLRERFGAGNPQADTSALAELDRLETTLRGLGPDRRTRDAVAGRLRALLADWGQEENVRTDADTVDVAEKIREASASEVLAFIDDQLGRSSR
ncbi:KR domain-containing protein [Nocardiopsis ansamitocini]|uniref:Carrier domain-containing protein n=1 Tax=Nocardiopsis ansamitocini TaxID=1670832 RepID=A0A9W6UJ39_9ACTN|nr:KR domain-containing protein [Nocardiopsis ansamitocini]GLU50536.1 hypothetical protein Nans01_48870 [Nocardiopsis ansamitocini]